MNITGFLKSKIIGQIPSIPAFAATLLPAGTLAEPPQWLVDGIGATSNSGVMVTELSAMRCTTVLKCVRILSETIASLPLIVYERLDEGGKSRAIKHHLYNLLHNQVNPLMTSFEWRETTMGHLVLWGNGYSEIQRNNGGRPIALWPLRPDKMRVIADGLRLRYFYTLPNGEEKELPEENVLHIKGLSANGYVGQSMISFARESIGLALAAEEFGARFFSNDATPTGILEHPGRLGEEAQNNIKKSWNESLQGLSNKFRMQILEEGMSYKSIGMPLEDAQFLENRKYQDLDIAGIFRIPAHMVNNLDRSSFSNIEHQGLEFVIHTIRPWLVRWEQAMKRDLILPSERDKYFVEYLVDALLRGDIKSRFEAYKIAREIGVYNSDDIREKENDNPLPNGQGKIYIVPMNFQSLEELKNNPSGKATEGQFAGLRTKLNGSGGAPHVDPSEDKGEDHAS